MISNNFIDKRRSVRNYTDKLQDVLYGKLMDYISNSLIPLFDYIKYEIKVVDADKVRTSKVKAPNYILFYSENKQGKELNAGFIMQQIDLFLQSNGAGSCWLGLASPLIQSDKGYQYIIMLSAGMTDKPLREGAGDFKRKTLDEAGDLSDKDLLQAVRLAPSAVNCQPWYYKEREKDIVDVYLVRKILHKAILKRYDKIDIGISLYHLVLALKDKGKNYMVITPKNEKNCIVSIKLI